MPREFDNATILAIREFERLTRAEVRDCLIGETVYFLVNTGKAALAIGRAGNTVRSAETQLNKAIKIYEWDADIQTFIRNLIPTATKISIAGGTATVSIPAKDRGAVIGRRGVNIRALRELLVRNSELTELRIV